MFDIGFSELVLILVVGLVVLGPKRMPIAIRTVMGWVRTVRNLAANVQNELSQELKLQELQESIKKAEHLNLKELSPELGKTVEELKVSAQKMKAELEQKANSVSAQSSQQANNFQQTMVTEPVKPQAPLTENFSMPNQEGKSSADLAREEREKAINEMLEKYQTEDSLANATDSTHNIKNQPEVEKRIL